MASPGEVASPRIVLETIMLLLTLWTYKKQREGLQTGVPLSPYFQSILCITSAEALHYTIRAVLWSMRD